MKYKIKIDNDVIAEFALRTDRDICMDVLMSSYGDDEDLYAEDEKPHYED